MSSAQETHILPPPKHKLSPLELRNADLVSRLLAATPPYFYNMSLLPNTYFFSEMLRSFVQAKAEQRGNSFPGSMLYNHQMRRQRKRSWMASGPTRENFPHHNMPTAPLGERAEKTSGKMDEEPWLIKSMRKNEEAALELTTSNGPSNFVPHQKSEDLNPLPKLPKLEEASSSTYGPAQHQENNSNLVLPPPPPIWYPPIYPTPPYAIDPLHFFIDLRVSGHIYDRNNQPKEPSAAESTGSKESEVEEKEVKMEEAELGLFNQKRHCSAFSVPNSSVKTRPPDKPQTKFDVKSMGFDKSSNKTSINYIMGNITDIYKSVAERESAATPRSSNIQDQQATIVMDKSAEETEEEKQKKVKDLRALIGLELVVDYMSHKKSVAKSEESLSIPSEEGGDISSEVESCESPPLEVVALHDEA
ncbi:uncharacterized protein LOC126734489 isoform X4 [Anthonomus grandis grandis]|uniref:uncharacterized protein LOC126734489 isoform X2 n=1 Tax=Anthonomus grandis grandis TaxID=2921223 RepID=UPI002165862A|nr:uncharacterized protein LOC126734489 isoform X2 [Anthonomus grandis grandis]XP_050294099.1 uncharacterized protein LOC126734489 isoform X4 [Anthonomus grandis grandis]